VHRIEWRRSHGGVTGRGEIKTAAVAASRARAARRSGEGRPRLPALRGITRVE
jgi:hypothetical protein